MLKKLYTATVATTMPALDAFSVITGGWYQPRYDAVWYAGSSYLSSIYKIFRDGTAVRMCVAANATYGYDADLDRVIYNSPGAGAGVNLLHDPISTKHDPSRLSTVLPDFGIAGQGFPFVWNGYYYTLSGVTVSKRSLTTGTAVSTFTLAGSLLFTGANRLEICPDGMLVAWTVDNGTYAVVRFFDLNTGLNVYESVVARSKHIFVDRANKNIWSIRLADSLMEVYSFDIEPTQFNPFTVGSNRKRYRQDTVTTTVKGAQNEPVPFCPVGWTLDPPDSGHLEFDYTLTDADGVATNTYCGPSDIALVGTDVTIAAWTGV